MTKRTLGKLPPRYSVIINPYSDERLSRCPLCQKLTHARKFALFIHVDDWGPFVLGKTCRYCTPCELVMIHQNELEWELADKFQRLDPKAIGNEYLVVGTVENKTWRAGLNGNTSTIEESFEHLADFKSQFKLEVSGGGWGPADKTPAANSKRPK